MSNVASRLGTGTPYIRDLNTSVRKGEIKIPQFQRPFVWGDDQALQLLDSIANNYPIGSLLLWRTADKLTVERNIGDFKLPETADLSPTEYVLDGQQRLTVVYSALGADPETEGFSAFYDLEQSKFISGRGVEPALHLFPLRWLYQTSKLLNFRTALQAHPEADTLQSKLDSLVDVLTGYQIPVVTLRDLSIEEVCPIFERINSSGTDLSVFDLMVAATWSKDFDLNATVAQIAEALDPKNFGSIKGTTILKCLAAVRDNSTSRERILALRQLRDSPSNLDDLVSKTTNSLLRAVDLLVTDFKLHSLDFLPYEAHLVILTHIYADKNSLNQMQLKRVRQWFWRTSFSERYRGAPDDFVTRDLTAVEQFVLKGDVDADFFGEVPAQRALGQMIFRKNNSRTRAFILALAKQNPRNITNGATIDTSDALSVYNKKQFHHIFPDAFLRKHRPGVERNYLLNFCMLAAAENNLVGDKDPTDYLPRLIDDLDKNAEAVFLSNLLPSPSKFDYSTGELADFAHARSSLVFAAVQALCDGQK